MNNEVQVLEKGLVVKEVEFNEATLLAVHDTVEDKKYVAVKWVSDGIGLSEGQQKSERKKVQEDLVLKQGGRNLILPTNGGMQEVLCIELGFLPLWLAKISITPNMKENNPELVSKLIEYQLKAKDVLESHFINQIQLHSYMIDDPIKRAEKWIEEQKEKQLLEQQVEEQKPLVTFAEKCIKTNDSILVRELAKLITEQGIINIGEKKLYKKLREWGLILADKTEPSQKAMNMGLFEVIQRTVTTPYGDHLTRTTRILPKGQVYIVEKLDKEVNPN